jgi:hypothetical protein
MSQIFIHGDTLNIAKKSSDIYREDMVTTKAHYVVFIKVSKLILNIQYILLPLKNILAHFIT